MNAIRTAYIVFDIETIPDGKLLSEVLYPGEDIAEEEAIARQEQEVLERTGGRSSFVPLAFHLPVAVAVARVDGNFRLQKLAILDEPQYRTERMVELFWKGLDAYPDAVLVDFGGRTFDLPVLELAAFRFGISVPSYFSASTGRSYRKRFSNQHLDLLDWFTNFGASQLRGGLDLLAKLIGKPGKLEIRGEQVMKLWHEGRKDLVGAYCLCDVLDTYFVFLRTRVLTGEISLQEEQALTEEAKQVIEEAAFEHPHVENYLKQLYSEKAEQVQEEKAAEE